MNYPKNETMNVHSANPGILHILLVKSKGYDILVKQIMMMIKNEVTNDDQQIRNKEEGQHRRQTN